MNGKNILACCALALLVATFTHFAGVSQARPRVVFVTGDHEYSSEETMPIIASELEKRYGMMTTVLKSYPDENAEENIPGLEALSEADLAVFYLRWRRLPKEQIEHILVPGEKHELMETALDVRSRIRSVHPMKIWPPCLDSLVVWQ